MQSHRQRSYMDVYFALTISALLSAHLITSAHLHALGSLNPDANLARLSKKLHPYVVKKMVEMYRAKIQSDDLISLLIGAPLPKELLRKKHLQTSLPRASFKREECAWCHGKANRIYADVYSDPPCSGYFRCKGGELVEIFSCRNGLVFDEERGQCVSDVATTCLQGTARNLLSVAPSNARRSFAELPVNDINALLKFKENVIDISGEISATWKIDTPLSKWAGVKTNAKTGRVEQLSLDPRDFNPDSDRNVFNIAGNVNAGPSIPPEFGNLTDLVLLNLQGGLSLGKMLGSIPSDLSRLTKLTRLGLASNNFDGPLPDFLSALKALAELILSENRFSGSLPASFGQLPALSVLDLSINQLNGSIPASLSSLSNLETLDLHSNLLTSSVPDSLSILKGLITFDLHDNQLEGPIPPWIFQLPALQSISLADNNFSLPIPTKMAPSLQLASLDLSGISFSNVTDFSWSWLQELCTASPGLGFLTFNHAGLSGSLPEELAACQALLFVDLSHNQFSGQLSTKVIPPLAQSFDVSFNALNGSIPASMASLNCVAQLSLNDNQLTGPIPSFNCSATCPAVGYNAFGALLVQNNKLTGQIPQSLNKFCSNFFALNVTNNLLSGDIPKSLLDMENLLTLEFAKNRFTGPLPVPVSCNATTHLDYSSNRFSGPLPVEKLKICESTTYFDASDNQLSGEIPPNITNIGGGISVVYLNISSNNFTGGIPEALTRFGYLVELDLSHNHLTGSIPAVLSKLQLLETLNLESNHLSGGIPAELGNLTTIKEIRVNDNELEGAIPAELGKTGVIRVLSFFDASNNSLQGHIPFGFDNASSDAVFIFSNNNLSGQIPPRLATNLPATLFTNNSGLCGGSGYPRCPSSKSKGLSNGATIGVAIGGSVGALLLLALLLAFFRRKRTWTGGNMLVFEKLDYKLTIGHVLDSTENFSDKYKLGRGGFGTVYRASLQDGRTVAIKKLAAQSQQGEREFEAEMSTLGNIRHRNLVTLIAAYIAPPPSNERLLIYNFLSGGSLDGILGRDVAKDSPFRQWHVRLGIATDTARGLKYLHHDCTPRIIHRDMKPANVLLDDAFVAHVADFGLAREVDMSKSHMSTAVFGTIGYLAPEYTQRGRLTFKSDVFAFGVLLLQLITGKQPTDEDVAERGLARWVGANSASSIVDPRMEVGDKMNEVLGAIKLGLLCTARVAADRPSMAEAVHLLENLENFAKGISEMKGEGKLIEDI